MAGQNPISLNTQSPTLGLVPLQADSATALANPGGLLTTRTPVKSKLNVTGNTVIKAAPGRLHKIVVASNSGTLGFSVYDNSAVSGVGTATLITTIGTTAATGGVILDFGGFPCANGIVTEGGAGVVLAVAYS